MVDSRVDLLIVGAPRSGTTLLSAMLSSHPDVALSNEDLRADYCRILSKRVVGAKFCIPNQIDLQHSFGMRVTDRMVSFFESGSNRVRKIRGVPTRVPRGGKAKLSISEHLEKGPQARILGILRSPRSSTDSMVRRGGQSRKTATNRWMRATEVLYELLIREKRRFAVTHFDDLVTSPETLMARITAWLDLEYDEAMLEGYRYTPQYQGRTGISADRAGNGLEVDLDHPILRENDDLRRKYIALLDGRLS